MADDDTSAMSHCTTPMLVQVRQQSQQSHGSQGSSFLIAERNLWTSASISAFVASRLASRAAIHDSVFWPALDEGLDGRTGLLLRLPVTGAASGVNQRPQKQDVTGRAGVRFQMHAMAAPASTKSLRGTTAL